MRDLFQTVRGKGGPTKNEYHRCCIKTNGFLPPRIRPRCRSYTRVGKMHFLRYLYPFLRLEALLRYNRIYPRSWQCPRRQICVTTKSYVDTLRSIYVNLCVFILHYDCEFRWATAWYIHVYERQCSRRQTCNITTESYVDTFRSIRVNLSCLYPSLQLWVSLGYHMIYLRSRKTMSRKANV